MVQWTAVAAVLSVAGVAAWVSYWHAVGVVSEHGEPGLTGHLYPVVIDGLIVAASMVLLDSARHKEAAPPLAWWMLSAGIVATLGMNVLAGLTAGWLGAIVAAWPALAFVGCYELLMVIVRAAARRASVAPGTTVQGADETVQAPEPEESTGRTDGGTGVHDLVAREEADETVQEAGPEAPEVTGGEPEFPQASGFPSLVPRDAEAAAEIAMRASVAAFNPLSVNALSSRYKLTRKTATEIRRQVLAEARENEPGEDAADPSRSLISSGASQ